MRASERLEQFEKKYGDYQILLDNYIELAYKRYPSFEEETKAKEANSRLNAHKELVLQATAEHFERQRLIKKLKDAGHHQAAALLEE